MIAWNFTRGSRGAARIAPSNGEFSRKKRMLWAGSSKSRRDSWYAASPDTEFFLHEFPAAENIPHDFIDPLQPDAHTEKINTLLVNWLTQPNP